MDKISGILPSTNRVTNVDLKDSPASRAVNPGLAKVEGASHLQPSDMLNAPAWKTRDEKRASIVSDIGNSFFMKNKPEVEVREDMPQEAHAAQPEGLYPKGSFIDRNA